LSSFFDDDDNDDVECRSCMNPTRCKHISAPINPGFNPLFTLPPKYTTSPNRRGVKSRDVAAEEAPASKALPLPRMEVVFAFIGFGLGLVMVLGLVKLVGVAMRGGDSLSAAAGGREAEKGGAAWEKLMVG
jgi:hypothetical protein